MKDGDMLVATATKFESLLREASRNPKLWVPGIGNGALGNVLRTLNEMNDADIIHIVRESCK